MFKISKFEDTDRRCEERDPVILCMRLYVVPVSTTLKFVIPNSDYISVPHPIHSTPLLKLYNHLERPYTKKDLVNNVKVSLGNLSGQAWELP